MLQCSCVIYYYALSIQLCRHVAVARAIQGRQAGREGGRRESICASVLLSVSLSPSLSLSLYVEGTRAADAAPSFTLHCLHRHSLLPPPSLPPLPPPTKSYFFSSTTTSVTLISAGTALRGGASDGHATCCFKYRHNLEKSNLRSISKWPKTVLNRLTLRTASRSVLRGS